MTAAAASAPLPIVTIGGEHVTANYRYIAAYNEVVARIGQRQQTLTLFVAIFTGLVTALIASRELFATQAAALDWLMVGFPAASVSLSLLNAKYERLLSILRGYLAALEQVRDAHLLLPSYNCDTALIGQANTARRHHDMTCAVLIIAYNLVALGIFSSITPKADAIYFTVVAGVASIATACVVAHLLMGRKRYQPFLNR